MKNFVQEGKVLTVTAPYHLASGQGCLVGNLFGVSCGHYESGDTEAQVAVAGVFDLDKAADAFSQGDIVYWNNTDKVVCAFAGANRAIGVAVAGALAGADTVRVAIQGLAFDFFLS